ncbi:ubiquitin-conjugating enzyme family protein [Colletotrichum incanum]|uniref:Ubiquitin-conjugating enzyme family protein n=1 Tax=Colletotrichum incanum TaxID=1573173 RepID=A0A161W5H8_COLIC|nr:ubiquitin-conjugating enzyme family protein [Colletotrichum incanum]OHX00117.1 ubiquitin-conjugating enzyme family protein [Colletotrichum incanum]
MAELLQRRLLQDIAELQHQPYPRISLHTRDDDLRRACLVLQPEGWMPMHTTVIFADRYPLVAPAIEMNTAVQHPNVYGSYICASILNTSEGYTPAYTLKGIAIQMLSFFNSESVEQGYSENYENLDYYRRQSLGLKQIFSCPYCGFDGSKTKADFRRARRHAQKVLSSAPKAVSINQEKQQECVFASFPDELLLETLESLDFADLMSFSHAWPRVAEVIRRYDVIRLRELQCFVTKTNLRNTKLGVGVSVPTGKRAIESEFDLVSLFAYQDLSVRLSIHHIGFEHWLPLPLSRRHWRSVEEHVPRVMRSLARAIALPSTNNSAVGVLAAFMNDIVVRLNQVEARTPSRRSSYARYDDMGAAGKSTLRHASEKAIESYFHLFHLLLCLATSNAQLITDANSKIRRFMGGETSKVSCPNLGHLLVYLLISDAEITEEMRKAIITEAITRNVVWMLDKRGSNMPELSYMEPDRVSGYRLKKTFEANRTSYRLLMFSELFRRIARPSREKTLVQVRDELFDRHGAPPPGSALQLSSEVRRLHDIDNFPHFFREMGIVNTPTAERFTRVLRDCVRGSMHRGYSVWGLPAATALALRRQVEPNVGLRKGIIERSLPSYGQLARTTFFPGKRQQ